MSGMILHAGAEPVARDALLDLPEPESQGERHFPIPHHFVLDTVLAALDNYGLRVTHEEHGLWKDGSRYFGLLQVENGNLAGAWANSWGMMLGLRNSHDKSFSAALALGSRVFVCDNLSFTGDVRLARKHTRFIERDLPGVASRALASLWQQRERQVERYARYVQAPVNDRTAHDVLIRAVDTKVISNAGIRKVLGHWRRPEHEEFEPRVMWSLFNAFTAALKGTPEYELPTRTRALYALCDRAVEGELN